ncbi:formate/nitrite transporter [Rhodovulum imhoffii]|uniref:Formate/nitrite transporter n=1 Tax=Rhodovulum imhoffii TaxID=365340 RepID=A0A2T5BL55_9RHOB|nr:formate/nitrite transporter family protein [Rhodovulum imhoffii]MBK5933656.1 formate transporter [Rhodovulum imhoffii]PTM99710.1 formate/nitrite transporter [Rhodovulum imhoffii]
MGYLTPSEFGKKMCDSGEAKIRMNPRDSFIRGYMAGAILTLGAAMAVTIMVETGSQLLGALFFPIGFCMLYLMGFDLITGLFVLTPLAWLDGRPNVTIARILKNWALVFFANFCGAFTTAVLMCIVFTFGFTQEPGAVADKLAHIGESRTVGYKSAGPGGWLTIFTRGALCNWMVSVGVIGAMMSSSVSGKCMAMWMPIFLFFYMGFEHSVVNMFLFPTALILQELTGTVRAFTLADYLLWNEIPTVLGNMLGGITLTGLTIYSTHVRTSPELIFSDPKPIGEYDGHDD